MSEHQSPTRFQIAPDPQTAHLPLDHPIRRRSLLLSLAGAAALQACGGDVVGSAEESADAAALTDEGLARAGAQAVTATPAVPYAWTELVADNVAVSTPFPDMDGSGLLSFNGYLYLIGGWNPRGWNANSFEKHTTNAVWRSSDGIAWENIKPDTYNTPNFNPQTDWQGRHAFGCVVFRGRMWIVGGDDMQGVGSQTDIWSSIDGVSWRKEGNLPFQNGAAPWTRSLVAVEVFNNAMWLMGGFATTNSWASLNDVWKSTDGKKWTQVLANTPNPTDTPVGSLGRWSPRNVYHQTAVFQNRLWVFGGSVYGTNASYPNGVTCAGSGLASQHTVYNDVWSTADGVNWRKELGNDFDADNISRWTGRFAAEVAVFDGKLWFLTGAGRDTPCPIESGLVNRGDVWSSENGKQWVKHNDVIPPRHASGIAVHGNTLRVVTGNMHNDSWMLSPYVWEKVPQRQTPHYGLSDARAAVSAGGKIWLLGGYLYLPNNTATTSNEVWSSPDGSNWTLVKADTYNKPGFNSSRDWRGRHMQSVVHFKNRLWVVGGAHLQPTYLDDVWSSADGKGWTRVSSDVACLKRVLHTVVKFKAAGDAGESIWVLGGQNTVDGLNLPMPEGRLVHYNDVWKSVDGITWTQVTANAPWAGRGLIAGAVVFNNRLWVIGGARYRAQGQADMYFNDVWSTGDGKTWKMETASAPWAARGSHAVCVFDKRMWVIGGYANGTKGDIWSSSDGVNWAQLPLPNPGDAEGAGFDCAVVVHAGVPHIIMGRGGQTAGASTDVWRLRRRDGKV